MSADYYSLLSRYVGHRVCLTLHSQTNVWGQVAAVCYEGLRLVDAVIAADFDNPQLYGSDHPADGRSVGSGETLVHLNQILAVTCLDEDLPEPPADSRSEAQTGRRLLVEPIALELGSDVTSFLEAAPGSDLRSRIGRLRSMLAVELGLLLPDVMVQESLDLAPNRYVVKLRGVTAARGEVQIDKLLALETGPIQKTVPGDLVELTPLGVPGRWIHRGQQERAELFGYCVIDSCGVLVAALDDLFRRRAPDLFGRQQLEELLDQVRVMAPAIAEEVLPELIRPRQLQKILRNLLREGVPVRDMETILESLSDAAHETTDPYRLTERVRQALASALTERYRDAGGTLAVVTLDPALERALTRCVERSAQGSRLQLTSMQSESLLASLAARMSELRAAGRPEVIVTTVELRAALRELAAPRLPRCVVLSQEEIEAGTGVENVGMVFYSVLFDNDEHGRSADHERAQSSDQAVGETASTPGPADAGSDTD